jgi:hypothetical protein
MAYARLVIDDEAKTRCLLSAGAFGGRGMDWLYPAIEPASS